jgi:HTH-type transcriptional regulator / antitoxin HigA
LIADVFNIDACLRIAMTNDITDHQQYLDLLAQIDKLFDDYETNKRQIDQLAPLLDKYEENASYFASLNQSLADVSHIQALLRVLMDQHGLGIDDFQNELSGPGDVTAILDGQLTPTPEQLFALSNRFGFEIHSVI